MRGGGKRPCRLSETHGTNGCDPLNVSALGLVNVRDRAGEPARQPYHTDSHHGLYPQRRIAAIRLERSAPVTLQGALYEVTNFSWFVQTYVMGSCRPDPSSVRPIKGVRITLCRGEGNDSGSPLPLSCHTDEAGRFELDLSQAPDAPVFVVAAGPEERRDNYCYRSACVRPGSLDRHPHEIYVTRTAIPDESGFSQADLVGLLRQTKRQVADLERITGRITGDAITLSGSGKGASASVTISLEPNRTGDLETLIRHRLTNFRLDLPGPAWLTGLLVSRNAVEESIRAGVCDLSGQINERLRVLAIKAFTDLVENPDTSLTARLAGAATLTLQCLRHPIVARQGGLSGEDRSITGDVCLGFPQTLHRAGAG